MQPLFLSWLNCSTDTKSHVNTVQQTSYCLAALHLFYFFFFLKKWLQIERIVPDLWFTLDILLSLPYSFIHSFNVYRVVTTLDLATGWLVLCPQGYHSHFTQKAPLLDRVIRKGSSKTVKLKLRLEGWKKSYLPPIKECSRWRDRIHWGPDGCVKQCNGKFSHCVLCNAGDCLSLGARSLNVGKDFTLSAMSEPASLQFF